MPKPDPGSAPSTQSRLQKPKLATGAPRERRTRDVSTSTGARRRRAAQGGPLRGRGPRVALGALGLLLVTALVLPPAWAGGRVDPGLKRPDPRSRPGKGPHPILGNANAPVTVMLFADLQCPFSRRLYERVLQRVVKDYAGRVRVVWRDFPLRFHKGARPASLAAREVYRQKNHAAFFEFISLVFKNYRSISTANLARWAQQVGADPARVRAAVRTKSQDKRVAADIAAGKAAGVRGTPHAFVFRGKLTATALSSARSVRGAQKYPKFKRIIDAMLGK